MQGQAQDAKRVEVPNEAVRLDRRRPFMAGAARADDDLSDTIDGGGIPVSIHRGKPLVVVIVPRQDQIHAIVVEVLPERRELRIATTGAGREAGVVDDGDHVLCSIRWSTELCTQPRLLRRPDVTTDVGLIALAIQHDHVPVRPDVVGEDASRAGSSRAIGDADPVEVIEVAVAVVCAVSVIVVAERRTGPRLDRRSAPRRFVATRELAEQPILINVVAECEYAAGHAIEDRGGRLVTGTGTRGDVAGAD